MRRCEQPLDLLFVSDWALVRKKRVHFLDRWREADEIEAQSAQQRDLIRLRRRLKFFFLQPLANKRIYRISNPSRVLNLRNCRSPRRDKRPVLLPIIAYVRDGRFGPISALLDPGS